MATFDIGHPDVLDFIRAKREDGRLRQFNLSLLITDEFMKAVHDNVEWKLAFPVREKEFEGKRAELQDPDKFIWREWPTKTGYIVNDEGLVACKVYRAIPARRLWDMIMSSTYDFAEPGFIHEVAVPIGCLIVVPRFQIPHAHIDSLSLLDLPNPTRAFIGAGSTYPPRAGGS